MSDDTDKHRDAIVRIIQAHGLCPDARDSILFHVDQVIKNSEERGHACCKDQVRCYLDSALDLSAKSVQEIREEHESEWVKPIEQSEGEIPGGGVVAALVAGIDTQDNGFNYKIEAFGFGLKPDSWLVRKGFVTSFKALEQLVIENLYCDVDGFEYQVHLTIQDAGGHRTKDVYDFCLKHRGRILPSMGKHSMPQPFTLTRLMGKTNSDPDHLQLVNVNTTLFRDHLSTTLTHPPTDCDVLTLVAAEMLGIKHWPRKGQHESDS